MSAKRAIALLAATPIALAALMLGTAGAAKDNPKLKITKIQPDLVAGKLSNTASSCVPKRKIVLKYAPPVLRADGAAKFEKLGTAKTNRKGKWKRKGDYFIGTYRAVLKPVKKKKGKRDQFGRKEDAIGEEEADEEDELDDPEANAASTHSTCTGTRVTKDET